MDNNLKWQAIDHFEPYEFDDPDVPGSGIEIDGHLLFDLNRLRRATGWPIIPHWEVGGCIDVNGNHGHAKKSYHRLDQGAKAVDFHFDTKVNPRTQCLEVEKMGFPGVGFYYDWHWDGKKLKIGFHVDRRARLKAQRWTRRNGNYLYWWKA